MRVVYNPPKEYCPDAAKYMKELVKLLNSGAIVSKLDTAALTLLGNTYNTYCLASQIILKEGIIGEEGRINPCIKIANDAQIQLQKLLIEFGLTPKGRKRITPLPEQEPQSPIDKFISSKREVR
jgi:P27 family predicted phage terminase small subunit